MEKFYDTMKGKRFKHYKKGDIYEILYIAKHTETEEQLVIYFNIEIPGKIWARPAEMFFGMQDVNGVEVKRFTLID